MLDSIREGVIYWCRFDQRESFYREKDDEVQVEHILPSATTRGFRNWNEKTVLEKHNKMEIFFYSLITRTFVFKPNWEVRKPNTLLLSSTAYLQFLLPHSQQKNALSENGITMHTPKSYSTMPSHFF